MRGFLRRCVSLAFLLLFGVTISCTIYSWRKNKQQSGETIEVLEHSPSSSDIMMRFRGTQQMQEIPECSCFRKFFYPPAGDFPSKLRSSCSDEASFYHANQKVVSFSFFIPYSGKNGGFVSEPDYVEGIRENLKMMKKYYPDYTLRLYTNVTLTGDYCPLVCDNSAVFWCNVRHTASHGDLEQVDFRTWRFLPLGDPTVDVFLIRDLDSLISAREVAVVEEWLSKGDKAISLMRDQKKGHDTAILGGGWQANNTLLGREVASKLQQEIIRLGKKESHHHYGYDQRILRMVLFEPRADDIVAYDSYHCDKWSKYTLVRPFPTQRQERYTNFILNRVRFVGGVRRVPHGGEECPVECRPKYGKHWKYC